MTDDIDFPEDTRKSRLTRTPRTEDPEDFARAVDRIAAFWRKHPAGNILTEIEAREIHTEEHLPYFVFTARAFVRKDATAEAPDTTAHATRSEADPDHITAQFAQETAETAAISRALRNLGILAKPRRAKP